MNKGLEEIKKKIVKVLKKYGVKKAGIFGSYVRGENEKESDIDVLIETPENFSLFDFVGLKLELEKVIKRKVDLVDYKTIKKRIRKKILNEEVKII